MLLLVILCGCIVSGQNTQKAQALFATINVDETKEPTSKYLFGMFMENLGNDDVGNLVDDCLWAELLDDRKFFYPVDTIEVLTPINRKEKINQWKPLGNSKSVTMDSSNTYVGVHSPKVSTSALNEVGIFQSGIAIQKNRKYTGRIILSATPNVKVQLRLHYPTKKVAQDIAVYDAIASDFTTFNFDFKANTEDSVAILEITGLGFGNFTIGAVSLMPADNVYGFRKEVVTILKDLNSGIYRWGGNFISGYDWRDGVGNLDKRPPRYEFAWNCLEDNDVGTVEMIRLAELLEVELSMTVNTGFGDAFSAAQWVEYVNGSKETDMGKLRSDHGYEVPFDIKLWCVGNESYGWWQLGSIKLSDHIIKHNMFVQKMLEKDPSLKFIGSGASIEEMTITESSFKANGILIPEYGSATDWTGGMLEKADHLSFVSEHFYCSVNERFDLSIGKYVEVSEPLEDWTRRPANRIKAKAEHYAEYHRRFPDKKNIPVYLDEWAYYTNWVHPAPTLGATMGYARALNELFRHTDLIKMAGFTFATSCLSFNDTEVSYNTTGLLFKLYQSQLESIPLVVHGNSSQPNPKWPVGGEQPLENAGGELYPLDLVATISQDKKKISIAIVNPTSTTQKLKLDFGNQKLQNKIVKWTMSGNSIEARNRVNGAPEASVKETTISNSNELRIDAESITILKYSL